MRCMGIWKERKKERKKEKERRMVQTNVYVELEGEEGDGGERMSSWGDVFESRRRGRDG